MSNNTITTSSFSGPSSTFITSSADPVASSSAAQESFSSSAFSEVSSSVAQDSTTVVEPSSTNVVTSIVSAPTAPASTELITSVVTQTPSAGQTSLAPVTVVVTSVYEPSSTAAGATSSTKTSSSSSATGSGGSSLPNSTNAGSSNKSSGLSAGGKTAVAVVVPVVVVALLVIAGLFLWRRRKQRKNDKEARRKEVEDYGYNPNNDPTLPVVASDGNTEMAEDHGNGYRGWGNAPAATRKASTTMSGGHTAGQLSDAGSAPGAPHSPTYGSDGYSGDGLVQTRDTMNSDDLGALGAAPVAGSHRNNDIRRGPSNASSSYSAGNRSDHSDSNVGQAYSSPDMYQNGSYGYNQPGPYGDGTYGGAQDSAMPVVRDVSARRNTRIEAGGSYQQGNSGIAQNF